MPRRVPLVRIDAGWPFLLAGLALLGATVLIPAQQDLEEAQWRRDTALAVEKHRLERIDNYVRYLDAVNRGEEAVVLSLVAGQLHAVPVGRRLLDPDTFSVPDATIFPSMEPPPPELPPPPRQASRLGRWATDAQARLWLIALGALCVLVGAMPMSRDGRPAA